jgi:hypothetical protein
MTGMKEKGIFKRLRKTLFGNGEQPKGDEAKKVAQVSNSKSASTPAAVEPAELGHFIQIGFDFGTAFSKCVYRDVLLDKAWVHLPPVSKDSEMPFLLPSVLHETGGVLSHPGSTEGSYKEGCLYHVKMALEKAGKEDWGAQELIAYQAIAKAQEINVAEFVEACAVYLIAGSLGGVLQEVKARFKGASTNGQIFVNMAVPVADIDHPKVNEVFDRVLRRAWVLAKEFSGFPKTEISELLEVIRKASSKAEGETVREACFLYPEVSANVQAFVRSRVSREGLYLFSDTGAGTVDQSVFLFSRPDGKDRLTYLIARVLPLGSSHIELRAAAKAGKSGWQELDHWRERKESGQAHSILTDVRNQLQAELSEETYRTVGQSKLKLISPKQINDLKVIFGGGGHCRIPYRDAVLAQFDSKFFNSGRIDRRRLEKDPFDIGMPTPLDLELPEAGSRWLERLTVAYGLSFEQGQLADFTLPTQVKNPTAEELWKPRRTPPRAPSKDDC